MRLATESDFYGEIYTCYRHHEGYAKRARLFENFPEPILVAGCGFGFLVDEFLKLGKDAWGIDLSKYAVENRVNDHVARGNILDHQGNYETIITEDLLPYLTDEEAQQAAENCKRIGRIVIHLVTVEGEADLNYHSLGYWMNLTGQLTASLEGM